MGLFDYRPGAPEFEQRVDAEMTRLTGPWVTEQKGPLVVRYRRRPQREFVALGLRMDDVKAAFLRDLADGPIGRLVWWLNGKLGGPSKPI